MVFSDPLERADPPPDQPRDLPPGRPFGDYLFRGCLVGLLIVVLVVIVLWLMGAPVWASLPW